MSSNFNIGKNKTFDLIISQSSNLVSLLILIPRFQILHFPGPEMARLCKNFKQNFGFFQQLKFEKFDNISLTSFFFQNFLCNAVKVVKNLSIQNRIKFEFFFKEFKFSFAFLEKNGHFCTLKYKNLEYRHQHCQST